MAHADHESTSAVSLDTTATHRTETATPTKTDILILGAGWTSSFLVPLLQSHNISFTATSRDGSDRSGIPTIPFAFNPTSDDSEPFKSLPDAGTILITFPVYKEGGYKRFVKLWKATHVGSEAGIVQLGSTGIYDGGPTLNSSSSSTDNENTQKRSVWTDRHSLFNTSNERARAEVELLELSKAGEIRATVLNLCGLWGGTRSMRNYVGRVAPTKEALAAKGSIHLIHGLDVARAILAIHTHFPKSMSQRWLLTDGRVYDWWDLASAWGSGGEANRNGPPTGPQIAWVRELMDEDGVRALPRPPELLGRALDSREFWRTFGLSPVKARVD